jgi:hypothetical protein
LGNNQPDEMGCMYFNSPFRPDKAKRISKVLINFKDSIPNDSLTLFFSDNNYPEAFSRDIHTAVCIDTLCRLVNITLYWEITGKYLGYSLPSGEELTKREHIPFLDSDYLRLNEILSDSSSQLGYYTMAEIHPPKQKNDKTDGITGATIPDLSSWIVPEAAYTSYTLWHLAYGITRDSIVAYTKRHLLSNSLLISIMQKKNPYSQIKALQWAGESDLPLNQFSEPASGILHGGNYYASRQAMNFLKKCRLDNEHLQTEVIPLLDSEDFRIKNIAIEYLRTADQISQPVARQIMTRINSDNYYLVNVLLTLLEKRAKPDEADQLNLCKLLDSKNPNIANRVYYFLLNLPDKSPGVEKQLNRYRKKVL